MALKQKQNILFDFLFSLSNKELQLFCAFVDSRYFNTDNYLVVLLAECIDLVENEKGLTSVIECEVYEAVFDNKTDGQTLTNQERKLFHAKMGDLHNLAKMFMRIEALKNDDLSKNKLLNKELLNRKLKNTYSRQLTKDAKLIVLPSKVKGEQYYELALQYEEDQLEYLHATEQLRKKDNLSALVFNLDVKFLISRMRHHFTMLSLQRVSSKKDYDFTAITIIKEMANLSVYKEIPIVQGYTIIIELMETDSESMYLNLVEFIKKYKGDVSEEEIHFFYTTGVNFCIGQVVKGKIRYNQTLFELYQTMEYQNLMTYKGFIKISRLKNVITASCRVNNFKWARNLLNKYELLIQHNDRIGVSNFYYGMIAFYEEDFKLATRHFGRVEKISTAIDLNAKIMTLKSYYQLDEDYDERSMTIFRTAAQFIKKHKELKPKNKQAYGNFIRIFINLYRIKHRATKMTILSIEQKLSKMNFVSDKRWLNIEMEILRNRKKRMF